MSHNDSNSHSKLGLGLEKTYLKNVKRNDGMDSGLRAISKTIFNAKYQPILSIQKTKHWNGI